MGHHEMRGRHDSNTHKPDTQSIRSNSLNKSESVNSKCTEHGSEESPRRLMGLKWNQGGTQQTRVLLVYLKCEIIMVLLNSELFQQCYFSFSLFSIFSCKVIFRKLLCLIFASEISNFIVH